MQHLQTGSCFLARHRRASAVGLKPENDKAFRNPPNTQDESIVACGGLRSVRISQFPVLQVDIDKKIAPLPILSECELAKARGYCEEITDGRWESGQQCRHSGPELRCSDAECPPPCAA
jgi:hypothetical protein